MTIKTNTLARRVGAAMAALAVALVPVTASAAGGDTPKVDRMPWTFGGFNGHFDKPQLQRGFQVYTEVCASCHGLTRIFFRNLSEPGGPEFPEDRVKSLAATKYKVADGPNEKGKMFKRAALLSDTIPWQFINANEARDTLGALPPDLSLIVAGRSVETDVPFYMVPFNMLKDIATGYQEAGADYVYALLTGYGETPAYVRGAAGKLVAAGKGGTGTPEACASVTPGEPGKPDTCNRVGDKLHYNRVFAGHQIGMQAPLRPETLVKYKDGTPNTTEQQAKDVVAFLAWASDPKHDERKRMGKLVLLYMLITSVLLGLAKRRLWATVPH